MVKLFVIAVMLAASTAARAEPIQLEESSADPETAQRLSLIGSAIPIAAIGVGTVVAWKGSNNAIRDLGGVVIIGGALAGIVTPSLGQLYSHHWVNGTMLIRAGGVAVELMGILLASNSEIGDCADAQGPCHIHASTIGMLASGAALYLGATAWDVLAAPDDARAWNHRHSVMVMPTAMRTPTTTAPGFVLSATF